ncbi:MAG: ATP-binding protein [Gammaproteobacteria bacterium]|nr:ATP-binding protein [Gammaproteobacteria bacterium]
MTDINIVDVTLHIDNNLDTAIREAVEKQLRTLNGVISVHMPADKLHLVEVSYNPEDVNSETIEHSIRELAGKVELIGL